MPCFVWARANISSPVARRPAFGGMPCEICSLVGRASAHQQSPYIENVNAARARAVESVSDQLDAFYSS